MADLPELKQSERDELTATLKAAGAKVVQLRKILGRIESAVKESAGI